MADRQANNQQYDDFGKGLNLFTRDTMLKENESAEGFNIWATGKNSIKKRPGIRRLCTIAGVDQIDGLGTYYAGATRKLLAVAGGSMYEVQTGTAVQVSAVPASAGVWTTKKRTDFCQAGGSVFVANGTENIRKFDGTTVRDQTGSVAGKWLIFYKSCLWTAGEPTSGNETRLYRSGSDAMIGNYTYDATGNPLATSKYVSQSDGQILNGFFKHQDYLYPVKERSMWRASVGTDTYQLITLEMIDPARGCDSHFSIDTVDNDNFMFNESGIYATGYEPNILDQIRTNIVSLRIDNKIKAIQKTRLDEVIGMYFDNHYYLSYTSGGGTQNDTIMVYDRQRLGWWEFQVKNSSGTLTGANCISDFKDSDGYTKLYFGSSTDGSIYYFDDTYKADDSYAITTKWKSKKFEFKNYAQMKFFFQVIPYFGRTPGNVTVNVYMDGALIKTRTITLGSMGFAGEGIGKIGVQKIGVGDGSLDVLDTGGGDFLKILINAMGRNLQIEIQDSNSDKAWELNALDFQYKPLSNIFQPDTRV
jgi:hypothetical protein